jgi:hypothetical protein
VILNASERRCDALVLIPGLDNDVLHIPLPDISLAGVTALHKTLQHLVKGDIPASNMPLSSSARGDMERLGITFVSQESDNPYLGPYQERLEKAFQNMLSAIWDCIVKPIIQGLALTVSDLKFHCK